MFLPPLPPPARLQGFDQGVKYIAMGSTGYYDRYYINYGEILVFEYFLPLPPFQNSKHGVHMPCP